MKVLTYEEWLQSAPLPEYDGPDGKPETDCMDCGGFGSDECPHCGQDAECETCSGSGRVTAGSVDETKFRSAFFTRDAYLQTLVSELKAWAEWTGRDRYEVLAENGVRVYCFIESKREVEELA